MTAESVAPIVEDLASEREFQPEAPERLRATVKSELKHLSFLSHELNNDLSAIHLHLELLKERLAKAPNFVDDVRSLELAQQSIRRTTDGMRRLLANARVRQGATDSQVRPVNLFDLATSVMARHRARARAKGLALSVEAPCNAVAQSDSALIALVLQNLVGNSVKYSTRGTVRVICRRQRRERGWQWVLSVGDEGPGIPPRLLAHVFAAFQRGEAHDGEGFGLGLAIALEAAGMLGADLWAESQVAVGSTFHLALAPSNKQCAVHRG